MAYGIIYCITNLENDKKYVGQTIRSLETRWKQHITHTKYYDFPLYRAIKKYGINNFSITAIDTAESEEELNTKETMFIKLLGTVCPNGYNAISGQPGNSKIISKETRNKISAHSKKLWLNPEYRKLLKEKTTGVKRGPITEDHRIKLSESHKGKQLPHAQKIKIGTASKTLWQNEEYAQKALAGLNKARAMKERPIINISTGICYCSASQAARELGLHQQNITKCCQGKRNKTGGYQWKYEEE
ncbi:MAG TPA: GIY-YIG nuclease family protein [Candidatus Omnitrophota bacterium]|nr:GIY-YIG nuclease family protein [Candidatus Omnitrophota bacterium]